MKKNKKLLALVCCMALLVVSAGATLAWLATQTQDITNTFTTSDINISLTESENLDLKMVPGSDITKDPKVTVLENSEACWLFVKVTESATFDNYLAWAKDAGWEVLNTSEKETVLYRTVDAATAKAGVTYSVLAGDKVSVKGEVTKPMMDALEADNAVQPTLTFKAYAVQLANIDTAEKAWTQAMNESNY